MNRESSDRIPSSSLILFASVIFTLTTYFTFKALWEVAISIVWLFVVLGLQFAVLLLGGSRVLTQLGAASVSAIIAVAACFGAVFLIFPPLIELRVAGAFGGGTALVFIMASFVAASRVDPVPSRANEPLVIGNLEDDQTAELIKYGEVQAPEAVDAHDPSSGDAPREEAVTAGQTVHTGTELPPIVEEKVYEFDELSESKLGLSLAVEDNDKPSALLDFDEESVTKLLDETLSPTSMVESPSEPDPSEEPAIPDDWIKEAARVMAYDASGDTPGDMDVIKAGSEEDLEEKPVTTEGIPGFRMRTRYKVLDATSGEYYGTYYGDEGYSTLDPISLTGLLGSRLEAGELRIVKLDWSNFDEVEVHIKVEEVVPIDLNIDVKDDTDETGTQKGQQEVEAVQDPVKATSVNEIVEGSVGDKVVPAVSPSGPRYMIYDRRTIQAMGEYVPEGDRSRIDRLTLYKMFPEYNFKTFEIDSIRWEADEVRIFIRGEKKSPKKKSVPGA